MSDWGLGMALGGLYGRGQKMDRNKEELATLQSFKAEKEHDSLMDEQAQMKKAAYENQVHDFANKLLGPDRDRINKKAKVLQARVREEIKTYGGDMSKFMSNGGHTFLNDYKNALVNSEESTVYIENQRNMKSLVDLQLSGKGHLINRNDMYSMKEYNNNSGGKISYTGLLNEIQMPDPDAYDYGSEIPAEDILSKNHTAIYGNFITEYPDNTTPTEQELTAYTRLTYGGKGENWQKKQKEQEEKNRHLEQIEKLRLDEQKNMYAAINGKRKVTKMGTNGEEVEVWEDGYLAPGEKGYTHLIANEARKAVSSRGMKQVKLDQFLADDDYANNPLIHKNLEAINSSDLFASHLNVSEQGFLDVGRTKNIKGGLSYDTKGKLFNQFAPAKAMAIKGFRGSEMDIVPDLLGITDPKMIDSSNKSFIGWKPGQNTFLPNGVKVKNNEQVVDLEDYKGDYHVRNVFIGATGKDKKGNQQMVMNHTDSNGNVIADKSKENLQATFGQSDINGEQLIIQLEDKYGQVFYEALEYTPEIANRISDKLGKKGQLSETDTDYAVQTKNQNTKVSMSKQEEAQLADSWNHLQKVDARVFGNAQSEATMIGGTYNQDSVNFVKSFYVNSALQSGANATDLPEFIPQIISDSNQNAVSMIADYRDEGLDVTALFRKGFTATQVLSKMIEFDQGNNNIDNVSFLSSWQKHIMYLDKFRTEYR